MVVLHFFLQLDIKMTTAYIILTTISVLIYRQVEHLNHQAEFLNKIDLDLCDSLNNEKRNHSDD